LFRKWQKKADLLRKLEGVIEIGMKEIQATSQSNSKASENTNTNETGDNASETSSNTSDSDTKVSSIFEEDEEKDQPATTDNSSVNSSNDNLPNQKPTLTDPNDTKFINRVRNDYIQDITELLNQEPVVKEGDLEEKNRNWLGQMKAATDYEKILSIRLMVAIDIREKRKLKKQDEKLDNIIESIPALFENQSANNSENFNKALQTINNSLGEGKNEVKAEGVKKAMINHDPEKYFESFAKWVEEEEKKIEEEKKKLEETDTISEIEYDEEEKQFLKGQISDQQKQEQIAKRIEVKVNVKRKSWSLWKWLKEQAKWLKTKARLLRKNNKVGFDQKKEQIKQEIKNAKNNSNTYARQAYQKNESEVNKLLAELDAVSQENQTVAPTEKGFFRPEVIVPVGLLVVAVVVGAIVIVRRKRKPAKVK